MGLNRQPFSNHITKLVQEDLSINQTLTTLTTTPLVYKAFLQSLSNGNPVLIPFNSNDANYLGDLVWTRSGYGVYNASYTGANYYNCMISVSGIDFMIDVNPFNKRVLQCFVNADSFKIVNYIDGVAADGCSCFVTIEYFGN